MKKKDIFLYHQCCKTAFLIMKPLVSVLLFLKIHKFFDNSKAVLSQLTVVPSASSPKKAGIHLDTSTLWTRGNLGFIPKLTHSQAPFWRKKGNLFLLEKGRAWPRGQFAPEREHGCKLRQHWLLLPRALQHCSSMQRVLRCLHTMPHGKLSCLQLRVARIALLWAVLFLALRTEEPHTHRKQRKNMSGPKKHSMSQRQCGVVTADLLQMVPGHSLPQSTHTVYTKPL